MTLTLRLPVLLSLAFASLVFGSAARSDAAGPVAREDPNAGASNPAAQYVWLPVNRQAAFAPRDGAGVLSFRDRMWLLGGWNPGDKVHFPRICNNEVWSSADGAAWTLEKPNTFLDAELRPHARLGGPPHGRLRRVSRQAVDHRRRRQPTALPERRLEFGRRQDLVAGHQGCAVGSALPAPHGRVSRQNVGAGRSDHAGLRRRRGSVLPGHLELDGRRPLGARRAARTVLDRSRHDRRRGRVPGPDVDPGRGHVRHAADAANGSSSTTCGVPPTA